MELNKRNIVNRINKLTVTYRVTWDDIVTDLDLAIDEINSYLSTKYPKVSTVLNEFVSEDKTYSYRAGGQNMDFFPEKYFHSIVIPYVIVQILTREEEFTTIYSKYLSQYQENLFVMARDEMNSIPFQFISAPKGVYFSNPDPAFRQNPEKYFNEKIFMDVPKIRVQYSWGDFRSLLPNGTQVFIEKPLPQDPNAYETGYSFMPVMMYGQNFSTYIVDYNRRVLGVFLGWSLQNNNDPNYIINQPITLLEDVTFYAVFDLDVIGVTYNGNGGTVFNWQPTFLSKEEFENSNGSITPTGGSANRKGYRFIGFKPEKEIIISDDPYAEANDIAPEETLKMNAQWYKMIYNITYVGILGNFTQTRMNYQYGDEFNLDIPTASEDNPDEFIGWFDNNQFMGDPITKINESDFGDKVFYANYNQEKYRIRWVTEEGFLINEDYLKKGSLLTAPPTTPKEPVWIDGLLYRFEFVNYFDSRNIAFEYGITKATRNETYIATYTSKIPVTTNIVFQYMETVNDEILSKQYVLDNIQVGSVLNVESDIVRRFVNEDKNKYTSNGTPYYMNGIKLLINGMESGSTLLFGSTIQITEQKNYTFACKYGVQGIPVNFKNVELSNGEYGLSNDFNEIIYFAPGTSRETIEEKGATLSFIEHKILNGVTTDYLQGFTNLIGDGTTFTEAEFPESLIQELFVVPYYTPQPNTRFLKKLTIVGLPDETSLNLLPPRIEYVDSNKTFDLSIIKDLTETNAYQKLRISEFYEAKISDIYMNLIQDLDIQVRNDRIVYTRTTTKDKINVIYRRKINASTYEDLKVITFWPYQVEDSIEFFPMMDAPENVTNYLGTSYEVQGWTLTDGSIETEEKIIINNFVSGDIILYPVFVRLGKIKVNFNFKTIDNNELLTNFSMNSTLVKELDYTRIGSIQILYNDYESFIRDLNYHSELNLFNDLTSYNETDQQIGYSLISYSSSLGESPQTSMPITLNLNNFQRSNIYDQDYEVTITMRYTRKTSYALLELGGFSKPNGSLSLYQYSNWNASPSQFERKIFVYKGRTYGSLLQEGTIPTLLTKGGDQLNYATYNEITHEALDINYSSAITGDTKIYINDYTPEEPIFRIIYMGLDGFDNYTVQLKDPINIYQNDIVGGLSFDLLANAPVTIPTYREQDDYQFIGWSVPEEGEGITNSINISPNRVDDFIVQATYVIPGKLNVRFKVIGEAGNELLTNYDLIDDPFGTDANLYKYSKDMTAYKNQVVGIQINTLLNEFKTAIGENRLAQRGYVAVAGRLDYNGITNLSGQTTYTQTNYIFSFDLRIADSHFYYNDVNLVFYVILRKVAGYKAIKVLTNSVPTGSTQILSVEESKYRKFFANANESFADLRTAFDTLIGVNPIKLGPIYRAQDNLGINDLIYDTTKFDEDYPDNITIYVND